MSVFRQTLRAALAASVPRRWLLVNGPVSSRAVCLTFDDGPDPEHTPRVLDALGQHGVTATFFVIGQNASKHPEIIRRIAAEGHALGHHSYYHKEPRQTSAGELLAEIERTSQVLSAIVGAPCTLFRPPKGELSAGKLIALRRAGLTLVLWNVDPKDYRCESSAALRRWFVEHPPVSGDIILLHDSKPLAAAAIGDLAAAVRASGLRFTHPLGWRRCLAGRVAQPMTVTTKG